MVKNTNLPEEPTPDTDNVVGKPVNDGFHADMINTKDGLQLLDTIRDEVRKRLLYYKPYPKQLQFHNDEVSERVLSGANRSGKSFSTCMETVMHCTGMYPSWFKGRKVKPVKDPTTGEMIAYGLVIGTDATSVRDILQANIIGTEANKFKDGMIHSDYTDLSGVIKRRGIAGGALEQIAIRRVDGGKTILKFRSYAQGRQYLQGFSLDFAHLDEEPTDQAIYGEIKARLADRIVYGNGFSYMSFTPLSGMTPLVQQIWKDGSSASLITMSMYDVPHLDPKEIEKLYEFLPEHEKQARMMGIPSAGSGRIYNFDKEELHGHPPYDGKYCRWLAAIDFGRGGHWNVVLYSCIDDRTDIVYVTHIIKTKHKTIDQIANLMKKYLPWCPTAYPHDIMRDSGISRGALGEADRQSEGFKYRDLYEKEGINMLYEHAKNHEGSMSVEVGIAEVRERIEQHKLKVAPHLQDFFDAMELYRYGDDWKPIKDGNEDICDALRYNLISLRHAEERPSIDNNFNQQEGEIYDSTSVFDD